MIAQEHNCTLISPPGEGHKGDVMKNAYTTPTLVTSGSTIAETLSGNPITGAESSFLTPKVGGNVGFYL
jgi:hypothetical protein